MRRVITTAGGAAVVAGLGMIAAPVFFGGGRVPLPLVGLVGLTLLALPLAHLYTIGRYRIFDLRLRVRRNVQYSLVSFAWAAVPFARAAVAAVDPAAAGAARARHPHDRPVRGADGDRRPPSASRAATEKGVLMVVAIALAFGLRGGGPPGAAVARVEVPPAVGYDYRRAAQSNRRGDLVPASISRDWRGRAGRRWSACMPVKRAGSCLPRRGPHVLPAGARMASTRRHGMTSAPARPRTCWRRCGTRAREISAAYAPPRIGDALQGGAEFEYIYPLRAQGPRWSACSSWARSSRRSAFQNDDFEFLAAIGSQVAAQRRERVPLRGTRGPGTAQARVADRPADPDGVAAAVHARTWTASTCRASRSPRSKSAATTSTTSTAAPTSDRDGGRRQRQGHVGRVVHVEAAGHPAVAARLRPVAARAVRAHQPVAMPRPRTSLVRDGHRRVLRHRRSGAWCSRAPDTCRSTTTGPIAARSWRCCRAGLGFGLSTRPIFAASSRS